MFINPRANVWRVFNKSRVAKSKVAIWKPRDAFWVTQIFFARNVSQQHGTSGHAGAGNSDVYRFCSEFFPL